MTPGHSPVFSGARRIIRLEPTGRLFPEIDNPATRARLMRLTRGMPFNVFLQDRNGLRVGNVVGLFDTGDLQLEIVPKVSVGSTPDEDARYLLDLLSTSGLAPRIVTAAGRIQHTASLLEAVLRAFADDLAAQLSQGPARRYAVREELSPVLRGRIDFTRLAKRPPGSDHLLPIRHAPLQADNLLSQVVLAAALEALPVVQSAGTAATLKRCADLLDGVRRVPLTTDRVGRLHLSALETGWASVVEFAAAVAQGRGPNPVAPGSQPFFSLLFPLDDLFEAVLRRSLPLALAGTDLSLAPRRSRAPLLYSMQTGAGVLNLKPDYLFHHPAAPESPCLVGDAKWKRLEPESASYGVQAGDVYQLITYMTYHKVRRGVLLFPADDWMGSPPGAWSHHFALLDPTSDARITLLSVDVAGLVSKKPERRPAALVRLRDGVKVALSADGP